ncbi:Uncharacterised protein [BD1-7 clade bacterium]|uniref:2-phospho-L-lactate guanylyltransferase n=1 Tax=BD1-7 clade bacterium TaxID=2029982 RepID=A0A5S9MQG9_9GAMM|nr:Uncharacterised protein [BD1-7 clade bacterium]
MNTVIAVFAKTPGLSPLKTRLAATVGTTDAEAFYRLSRDATAEVIAALEVDVVWAVAEENAPTDAFWHGKDCLWTGPGSLGDRLAHIYACLIARYDNVLLIGSDSPTLPIDYLHTAIDTLTHENGVVLGPCDDGGFYCLGSNHSEVATLLPDITYSSPQTADDLQLQLKTRHFAITQLPVWFDVDTEQDCRKLLKTLHHSTRLTPAQQALIPCVAAILA